jgi:hypothetical protein
MKPAPAISRIGLQFARQLHRQIAGEIAVAGLLGAFEEDFGAKLFGRHAAQCGAQEAGEMLADVEGGAVGCAGCGHIVSRHGCFAGP